MKHFLCATLDIGNINSARIVWSLLSKTLYHSAGRQVDKYVHGSLKCFRKKSGILETESRESGQSHLGQKRDQKNPSTIF